MRFEMYKYFNPMRFFQKKYFVFGLFTLLILLFYSNTLQNGFVYDDESIIVNNEYAHSIMHLPKAFTGCMWESELGTCQGFGYYRPFQALSYLLTYQISSLAWIFHLVNLLYFLIVVFLIFFFVELLTKNFFISFLSALIFLVHPINTEVVNWASAAAELLYAIFGLLTVIFYITYRQTNLHKKLYLAFLFYFFAILSKEPAVLIPLILLFVDFAFFKITVRKLFSWKEIKHYLIFGVVFLIYFFMRLAVLGRLGGAASEKNYYHGAFSLLERIYTFFTLFAQYLEKLFYPYPLLFFHSFEKSANFISSQFLISAIVAIIFLAAIYLFLKSNKNFFALSLVWFFVFLAPALFSVNTLGENVFSERYLFVPSIGFAFALSAFLFYLWQKKSIFKLGVIIIIIFIIGSSWVIVHSRNKAWKDNETLYTTTLVQNPEAVAMRLNLGAELIEKGDLDRAEEEYLKIIQYNPHWAEIYKAYYNLGTIYREKGNTEKAIVYYQQSIKASNGRQVDPYHNLATIYTEQEEYFKALSYLCRTLILPSGQDEGIRSDLEQLIATLKLEKEKNYTSFYSKLMSEGAFVRSNEQSISFEGKMCEENSCFYAFMQKRSEQKDPVLLFSIVANGLPDKDTPIKVLRSGVNQQTKGIIVEIDSRYKDSAMTFIFPTCEGVYYQARVESVRGQ